jgi:hypothetical protein
VEGTVLIQGIPLDQFLECVTDVIQQRVDEAVRKIKTEELQEKFLSVAEVCKMFVPNITRQTLANWEKKKLLNKHSVGRSCFYRYSEVVEAIKTHKKFTHLQT